MFALGRIILLGSMMTEGSLGGPPPGWYAQSPRDDSLRWWNGSEWTAHFRPIAGDAPRETGDDRPESVSTTRAARRALAGVERVAGGPGSQGRAAALDAAIGEVEGMPPALTEPGSASRRSVPVRRSERIRGDDLPGDGQTAPGRGDPGPRGGAGSGISFTVAMPPRAAENRRVGGSSPRGLPVDERPPTPIVYGPVPGSYVGDLASPLPEPTARNRPARASLVLLALALAGGVAVVAWLGRWDQAIAAAVCLVGLGIAIGGFFLAVGGLVVAAQVPTKKGTSVIALIASVVLVAWLGWLATTQALSILGLG